MNSESKQKLFGKIKKNMVGWVLILPTILAFTLFVWRPIIIGIGYSFFDLKGFKIQEFVGLKNYVTIFCKILRFTTDTY